MTRIGTTATERCDRGLRTQWQAFSTTRESVDVRYRLAASRTISVAAPTEIASSTTPVLVWP